MKIFSKTRVIAISLPLFLFFAACSHNTVVEEKPLTEKLGSFKNVQVVAKATDTKAQPILEDLSSMMTKRLTKAKLFQTVTPDASAPNADLIINADIFEAKMPEEGYTLSFGGPGEAKMKLNIRYTFISKKDNRTLASIQVGSDSAGGSSIGGIKTNTDKGYALGRSADELLKFIKTNL